MKGFFKMKRKPKNPSFDELKLMLPAALITNGLALVGIALFGIFEGVSWRAFTGLLFGNILFVTNFILMGTGAVSTVSKSTAKQGQLTANLSYASRYIGLFILLSLGLVLKIIDPIPTFIPLFIPKIHYTLEYTIFKKRFTDLDNI